MLSLSFFRFCWRKTHTLKATLKRRSNNRRAHDWIWMYWRKSTGQSAIQHIQAETAFTSQLTYKYNVHSTAQCIKTSTLHCPSQRDSGGGYLILVFIVNLQTIANRTTKITKIIVQKNCQTKVRTHTRAISCNGTLFTTDR